jgi:hypothetical protein
MWGHPLKTSSDFAKKAPMQSPRIVPRDTGRIAFLSPIFLHIIFSFQHNVPRRAATRERQP